MTFLTPQLADPGTAPPHLSPEIVINARYEVAILLLAAKSLLHDKAPFPLTQKLHFQEFNLLKSLYKHSVIFVRDVFF